MRDYQTVSKPADFPADQQAHLCVLEFTSVTIPGDERSRTHPGHGYPEHTESYANLIRFENQAALEEWILSRSRYSSTNFIVLSAQRVKVTESVKLEFDR